MVVGLRVDRARHSLTDGKNSKGSGLFDFQTGDVTLLRCHVPPEPMKLASSIMPSTGGSVDHGDTALFLLTFDFAIVW